MESNVPRRRAHLITNSKSGSGKGSDLDSVAQKICDELGWELVNHDILSCKDAVQSAADDGGVVIVAGGDGTIRSVAHEAREKNVRFAVVPCGTFNFFARTHNIPEEQIEAFRLALTGETHPVRLGDVNGHTFLINASLGLYAKAIRDRENRTDRFGRNRLVVIISTLLTLLSKHLLLKVDLVVDGQTKTLHTPMIYIGNNGQQLRNLAMSVAQCMKLDLLALVIMKPVTRLETMRIIFRGITKTLENDKNLDTFCVSELTIYTRRPLHKIVLDGELFQVKSPLRVLALPGSLNLVVPKEPS